MFTRVLVADDLDSINQGILMTANQLGIPEVVQVQYCDDAYLRIKRGVLDEKPFELLITDLSFKSDHRAQKYSSGEALIEVLHREHPDVKIIVYSIEDRPHKVRAFFDQFGIRGYVTKSRKGMKQLAKAIETVFNGETYVSPELREALQNNDSLDLTDHDLEVVRLLAEGFSQAEISQQFKDKGITPSSLSSIEKQLNKLKIQFRANNAVHLVAIVKDLGLI
jgi:DNA-binding NarL/FixJ family response regulator